MFYQTVYEIVRRIPRGKVATYGQVARLAGNPRMARQVGWALHQNPEPGVIPCHRVLNRFGSCCEGFAFGGQEAQRALLEGEGVGFGAQGLVDLARYQWDGNLP
ncbi:MAG: MGMT family protein [Oscillospiraceae bacterium]|jgi:methylated-DNA-protein-cysteine methyltransferase-like protein|nr:MGMT family protein [Oscillospiraceae bacterium]